MLVRLRNVRLFVFSAIAGLSFAAALVSHCGFSEVAHALFAIRWTGFVTIVAYRLAEVALLGLGWYLLTPESAPIMAFVWGRLARDSGSELLPLSQLGGFAIGARMLALLGVPGAVAIASTIVDVTLEVLGQLGYAALGLGILSAQKPNSHIIVGAAFGLVIAFLTIIAFILVQRHGFGRLERIARGIAHRWVKAIGLESAPIHDAIQEIYHRAVALRIAGFLHLVAWVASGVEAWIALRLMGIGLSIGSVIVIESLLYAIRSAAFAVPNALGVQEGAYIMLGALFGLSPEAALALSLLKRARDLVIGVPTLIAWEILESRRLALGSGVSQVQIAPQT